MRVESGAAPPAQPIMRDCAPHPARPLTPIKKEAVSLNPSPWVHSLSLSSVDLPFFTASMSSSGSDGVPEAPKTTRKHLKRTEKWKKSVAKKKRNSGETYTSQKTNKQIAARTIGEPCTCTNKCYDKIGVDNIQDIFTNFWGLGDYDSQNRYLHSLVIIHDIKRREVDQSKVDTSTPVPTLLWPRTPPSQSALLPFAISMAYRRREFVMPSVKGHQNIYNTCTGK